MANVGENTEGSKLEKRQRVNEEANEVRRGGMEK